MSGVGIVVLAAGRSVRMGQPKQLLPVFGQSMLRRAAGAAVESGCQPVVVVLGAGAETLRVELAGLPVHIAINAAWQRGIGSSIRSGFQALLALPAPPDAAVIMLCDQPLVDTKMIRGLVAAHAASGKPICASAYAGSFGPPVIVDARYFDLLLALPDDQGAKALWAGRPGDVHFEPCPHGAIDIDTPADYEEYTRSTGRDPIK